MSVGNMLVIGIAIAAAIFTIMLYNGLVGLKHGVAKAWANIDVLLKQRHDELPKLVEVCKQYKEFEQSTLIKVIEARSQVHAAREQQDMAALGNAEATLRSGLGQLFAVAEAYPELRSNQSFMQLQERITGLENAIADRRELYNDAVNLNNIRVEQFPDLIIARLFRFDEKALLEFSSSEKADVDLQQLFR